MITHPPAHLSVDLSGPDPVASVGLHCRCGTPHAWFDNTVITDVYASNLLRFAVTGWIDWTAPMTCMDIALHKLTLLSERHCAVYSLIASINTWSRWNMTLTRTWRPSCLLACLSQSHSHLPHHCVYSRETTLSMPALYCLVNSIHRSTDTHCCRLYLAHPSAY